MLTGHLNDICYGAANMISKWRIKRILSLRRCFTYLRFVAALVLLTCRSSAVVTTCSTNDHQCGKHFYRIRTNVMYSATSMSFRSCVKACQVRKSCEVMAYNENHRYCELGPNRDNVIYDDGKNFRSLVKSPDPLWVLPGDVCSDHTCAEMEICVPLRKEEYFCIKDVTMFTSDNRFVGMIKKEITATNHQSTYTECVSQCLRDDCPAFFFGNSACYVRQSRESAGGLQSAAGMVYYERTGVLGNVALRRPVVSNACDECHFATDGYRLSDRYLATKRDGNPYFTITLRSAITLTEVAILIRLDGDNSDEEYFGYITIIVYKAGSNDHSTLCTEFREPGGYSKMVSRRCEIPLVGDTVEIKEWQFDTQLSVYEVEVYGYCTNDLSSKGQMQTKKQKMFI
ncbi:uncharacterized protein [Argopecten irradians]|uniref:uncharacterized protein n=1 Tax=Argopecten irradians TaxID=31199 RepID=UPI003720A3CE